MNYPSETGRMVPTVQILSFEGTIAGAPAYLTELPGMSLALKPTDKYAIRLEFDQWRIIQPRIVVTQAIVTVTNPTGSNDLNYEIATMLSRKITGEATSNLHGSQITITSAAPAVAKDERPTTNELLWAFHTLKVHIMEILHALDDWDWGK